MNIIKFISSFSLALYLAISLLRPEKDINYTAFYIISALVTVYLLIKLPKRLMISSLLEISVVLALYFGIIPTPFSLLQNQKIAISFSITIFYVFGLIYLAYLLSKRINILFENKNKREQS